jgi:hypothetical protein
MSSHDFAKFGDEFISIEGGTKSGNWQSPIILASKRVHGLAIKQSPKSGLATYCMEIDSYKS